MAAPKLDKIKINMGEVEIVDVPTMYGMSDDDYRGFIRNDGLFFIDHHDILCSGVAGYPIATTREQLDIYIEELKRLRGKMVARSEDSAPEIEADGIN